MIHKKNKGFQFIFSSFMASTITLDQMILEIRQANKNSDICRDGLSGRCSRGDRCRFTHFSFVLPRAADGSEYCIADLLGEPCRRHSCGYFHHSLGKAPATRRLAPDGRQYCIDHQRGTCIKKNCNYYHSAFPSRIWSSPRRSKNRSEKNDDSFWRWPSFTPSPSHLKNGQKSSQSPRFISKVIEKPTKDQSTQTSIIDESGMAPFSLFSATHASWCLCEQCTE